MDIKHLARTAFQVLGVFTFSYLFVWGIFVMFGFFSWRPFSNAGQIADKERCIELLEQLDEARELVDKLLTSYEKWQPISGDLHRLQDVLKYRAPK